MLRRRTILKPGQAVDENTLMLLHFDEDLTAVSTIGYVVNVNSAFDLSDKKFGSASVYNSDYTSGPAFTLPPSFIDYVTSDFTIDFWVMPYQSLTAEYSTSLLDIGVDAAGDVYPYIYLFIAKNTGNKPYICVEMYDSANNDFVYRYMYLDSYPTTWCHVALVRSQDTLSLYFNGQLMYTPAYDYSVITNNPHNLQTECLVLNRSGSKIDEFRFSNIARWTANFTPPTQAY